MGSQFLLIADHALTPFDTSDCRQCGQSAVPIYSYGGTTVQSSAAGTKDRPDTDTLCAPCIKTGDFTRYNHVLKRLTKVVGPHLRDVQRSLREYNRTPHLPFIQGQTWAPCCGELAEFIGETPVAGSKYDEYSPWDLQDDLVSSFHLEDFYPLADLPVMNFMALFRCHLCSKKYWTFQYSGIFWTGPRRKRHRWWELWK